MRRHGTVMISTGEALASLGERRHRIAVASKEEGTCTDIWWV